MSNIECPFCDVVQANTVDLKKHLKDDHHIKSGVCYKFKCKKRDCGKEFKYLRYFLNHLDTIIHDVPGEELASGESSKKVDAWKPTPISFSSQKTQSVAELRLKTDITGSTVGSFVNTLENVLKETMSQVTNKIEEFFEYKGISKSEKDVESFLKQFQFVDSFWSYRIIRGQISALKKTYSYIEPENVVLGEKMQQKLNKKTGEYEDELISESFQYISMIETLKLVLSNKEVMDYIENHSNQSDDGFLRSFEDGEKFKNHPFFKKFPKALRIQLYYDEFLGNNPLGSKTHQQKIGAFYFSILNLPPHLNHFIGNVHVFAFCKNAYVKEYGIERILERFVDDLKLLEEDCGYPVIINDNEYILRATLATVTADTLAQHELLGYLSPSANVFCRLCIITRNELKKCYFFKAPARTKELHEQHLEEISIDPSASSESGVRCNSILNELKYVHGCENETLDDVHDLLHGQVPLLLKLVIHEFTTNKKYNLSVDELNNRIKIFDYGRSDVKNKPSANFTTANLRNADTDHKIHQTAAQTWCLLRIFPFLVFDKVPSNDRYLKLVINLCEIVETVFAPKLERTVLPYLDELVIHHYDEFGSLFPKVNRINKSHHIAGHMSKSILMNGPLFNYGTFKYECRHRLFIKYCKICNNFTNITKSMANIAQINQCCTWGTAKNPIRQKITFDYSEVIDVDDPKLVQYLTKEGINYDEGVESTNSVQVYGKSYEINDIVVIQSGFGTPKNMPVFGEIEDIFIVNNRVLLYYKEWHSQYLENRLQAFNVIESSVHGVIDVDDLCDSQPLALWETFAASLKYVCLRHIIY